MPCILFVLFCTCEILSLKKNKKFKTDLLTSFILLLCTTNENDMMYGSWDIERNWPNRIFCHFRHFLPFYSTNNSKIFEKMKKYTWTNHHFTQEYQKSWSYAILLLRYSTWGMELLYFILGYFYSFNPPPPPPPPPKPPSHLTAQKRKRKRKNAWRYNHFTRVPKIMIRWCMVPEISCATDGRTDRRKKWHIGVGGCPT